MSLTLLSNIQLDKEYGENAPRSRSFAKFATFTPDGSCFAFTTSENTLLFYDVDERIEEACNHFTEESDTVVCSPLRPRLTLPTNEDIRDFRWFPNFNRSCPDSSCFLIASRNKPVNLYDSLTGTKHLTYKPLNAVAEIAEIYSVDFHPLGKYFLCGSASCVYAFDIEAPGEQLETRKLSTRKTQGQKGIISCIAHNTFGSGNTYACGSYNSSVALYDHNDSRTASLVGDFLDPEFPLNPVTQIKWIDERKLLVGCRNDFYLRLYDVRGDVSSPLLRFYRPVKSNQKVAFDFKEGLIASGTSEGDLLCYDLLGNQVQGFSLSNLAIPVCNFNPNLPLLLLCSGTRTFESHDLDSPRLEVQPSSSRDPFCRLYLSPRQEPL